MLRVFAFFMVFSLLQGCDRHFIHDAGYRKMVEEDFNKKKALLAEAPENLLAVFDRELTLEEREALQFLFAYSHLIDIAEFGGEFLLENVRMSLNVKKEMPWGQQIPETIFRHFVLPVREGNERIDSSRRVFYHELRDRVIKCKSIEAAALEVNHWCHEKAIYSPTNARTVAPLTMTTTAYGRCGEEAIFALAALRSVGIPARQVYTPRWAHCDDNHAWIEVWADGEWKYMGACEPEPHLDMAWFTAPATRGVLMQAKAFGKYLSDEEVVYADQNQTIVNTTANYAVVKKLTVEVRDMKGMPLSDATVEYKIYNYGEFYPAAQLTTNERGMSQLTMGLGDWLVWAYKDGIYGFEKVNPATTDTLRVLLNKASGDVYYYEYDIIPPAERSDVQPATDSDRAGNDRRLTHEDSIRNAYIATFMSPAQTVQKAGEWGYDAGKMAEYIKGARGNYPQILRFLEQERASDSLRKGMAMALLGGIAGKDLQDITPDVLNDHLTHSIKYAAPSKGKEYMELFEKYVLNPRVKNEFITAYRAPLSQYLERNKIASVDGLVAAIKAFGAADHINKSGAATSPQGVINAGMADRHTKEVFFVAASRTMGIPARLNPVDGKPEYNSGGKWMAVSLSDEQKAGGKGNLVMAYKGGEVKDPAYYTNFTLSRIENGRARPIDLGSNASVDMGGGASFSNIFRSPIELECGDYLLVTGNRKRDGSVLTTLASFTISDKRTTNVNMALRDANEKTLVLGKIGLRNTFISEHLERQPLPLPAVGYTVLAFIEANKEPVNHLIRDMSASKEDFEQMGVPMTFLFKDKESMDKFSREDYRPLPSTLLLGYDHEGEIAGMLKAGMNLSLENLPVVLVVNGQGEIVFISQGYRVGMGRLLMGLMR